MRSAPGGDLSFLVDALVEALKTRLAVERERVDAEEQWTSAVTQVMEQCFPTPSVFDEFVEALGIRCRLVGIADHDVDNVLRIFANLRELYERPDLPEPS